MKPEEYLIGLAGELNLSDAERDQISQKHNDLRKELREFLPVEDDFLTGSYPRHTIISPEGDNKYDVDFFLAFSNADYGEYELPELLKMVLDSLEAIKRNDAEILGILEQNRSIAAIYDDSFQIDVVPAIEIQKDELYKIYDKRTGQPVESNPKLHGKNLTEANEATEYGSVKRLVPIIKLLKSWKRDKCDYMKSFHLELLAIEILSDGRIDTFASGLNKFFSHASKYLKQASFTDPANNENIIDAYLDDEGRRQELLDLIATEKKIAELAYQNGIEGDNDGAIREWKKVFESKGSNGGRGSSERSTASSPTIITRPPKQHCDVQVGFE